MAVTQKVADDMLRAKYMEKLIEAISTFDPDEELLKAKSNEIAIPTVNCNGDDAWVVLVVKVPKCKNGDGYDGYEMAQEYIMKVEEKERKAKEKEKKKKTE